MKPGFFAWREWRQAIGRFKGGKPRDPATRPDVPTRIPTAWWNHLLRVLGKKRARVEMYDDVDVSLIPVDAQAIAGYVDGRWPTYSQIVKKFGHARHTVSIAVFARDNADALDVEPGDASVSEAPGWIKRQQARGKKRPIVYTSLSQAQTLINACTNAGLRYGVDYLYWSAHYTGKPHLCSPKCGLGFRRLAHATQWTDRAGGKSLDESLCSAEFFE